MKLETNNSQAPNDVLNTADALVEFARSPQQLDDLARTLWPRLAIHRDPGHWVFYPAGDMKGSRFVVQVP